MVKNEVGNRYGKLVVVERVENDKHDFARWLCKCDCGGSHIALGISLRSKKAEGRSCPVCKTEDITGRRFSRLVVMCRAMRRSTRKASPRKVNKWYCLCDCGQTKIIDYHHLQSGHTKSCRCYAKEQTSKAKKTHGMSTHSLYVLWYDMKLRCEDSRHDSYELYSSKGRDICEEWKNDMSAFMDWALNNGWKKGLVLDREDNSLGYSPENCRFVTYKENSHNSDIQRRSKTGYAGVWYEQGGGKYQSYIHGVDILPNNRKKHLGRFDTAEQAVAARNNYIKVHKLPHRIQEIK